MCISVSELFSNILIDAVIVVLLRGCGLDSNFFVNIIHDLRVQVWRHDDVLLFHLFKILVCVLEAVLVVIVLNELGKYVAESDGFLHSRSVDERVANSHGCCAVVAVESLSGLDKLLDDGYPLLHRGQLHFFAVSCGLLQLSHRLFHGSKSFFIISVFVDLHLSASIIEIAKTFERFSLLIKADDGFHDLWIVMPVLILQEVSC